MKNGSNKFERKSSTKICILEDMKFYYYINIFVNYIYLYKLQLLLYFDKINLFWTNCHYIAGKHRDQFSVCLLYQNINLAGNYTKYIYIDYIY